MRKKDPRLKRAGVRGYNKPKRTPGHPTKSHIVVAKEGSKIKTIRFGQQGKRVGTLSGTAGKPKKGESRRRLVTQKILLEAKCLLLIGQIKSNGNLFN